MDFSKIDLSQDNWYSFLNIIEDKPEICISGNDKTRHKVKHFTYLYGLNTREIIKIGTSYYKHHSIKNHIKNEILLTILREIVEYKWADTVVINLEDKIKGGIFRFIDNKIEYFERKKLEILMLEDHDTRENMIYYDYNLQIENLKRDIIELFEVFHYDFLEDIERIPTNDFFLENLVLKDESIEDKLDIIKYEIIELLGSKNLSNEPPIFKESESESESEIDLSEKSEESEYLDFNFQEQPIDQEIQYNEYLIEQYIQEEKREKEYYEELIEEYQTDQDQDQEQDQNQEQDQQKNETQTNLHKELIEYSINKRIKIKNNQVIDINERLDKLKTDINQFKIDIALFRNNIFHFDKEIKSYLNK